MGVKAESGHGGEPVIVPRFGKCNVRLKVGLYRHSSNLSPIYFTAFFSFPTLRACSVGSKLLIFLSKDSSSSG